MVKYGSTTPLPFLINLSVMLLLALVGALAAVGEEEGGVAGETEAFGEAFLAAAFFGGIFLLRE